MEDIVSRDSVALLDHHDLCAEKLGLDGRPEPARAATDDENSRSRAGCSLVVHAMAQPGVKLLPQCLRLPILELRFELWVKFVEWSRAESDCITHVSVEAEDLPHRHRRGEVVEHLCCQRRRVVIHHGRGLAARHLSRRGVMEILPVHDLGKVNEMSTEIVFEMEKRNQNAWNLRA